MRLVLFSLLPNLTVQKSFEVAGNDFFLECVARVPVSLWGCGGWGCVRSTLPICSQPSATVRNRPRQVAMAVPIASSAKEVTFGGCTWPSICSWDGWLWFLLKVSHDVFCNEDEVFETPAFFTSMSACLSFTLFPRMDFSHLLLVEFWQAGISPMSVPDLWLKHEAWACRASTAFAASAASAGGGLQPSFSECVGKGFRFYVFSCVGVWGSGLA